MSHTVQPVKYKKRKNFLYDKSPENTLVPSCHICVGWFVFHEITSNRAGSCRTRCLTNPPGTASRVHETRTRLRPTPGTHRRPSTHNAMVLRAAKARTTQSMALLATLLVLVEATQVGTDAAQEGSGSMSGSETPTALGMRCYTSAGDAKQCKDGVQSCVTFVELASMLLESSRSDNASGTDKVTFGNADATCADVDLAQKTGIVCDGSGVQVTSTAAFAYKCCRGDLCNVGTQESIVRLKVTYIHIHTHIHGYIHTSTPSLLASLVLR